MRRDETEKIEDKVSPAFNSSLNYLDRISGLIRAFEMSVIDGDIKIDSWITLDMFRSELKNTMTDNEKKECENLKKKARSLNYSRLVDFFDFLNDLAHSKGLIMKNNVYDPTMPDAVRNGGGRR